MTTLAQFTVEKYRYLDEKGNVCAELPDIANNKEQMLRLYKNMLQARIFDRKAIAMQRTGRMGTYAPINGQEAISTAIGQCMQASDVFIPYYRDYAAQFQRGVAMEEIMAYWGGDERGSQFENNPTDFPISVPIASQCLHATGVGFAFKYRDEPRVAVVCVGDGGTSEGDFYEAINVAGAWNLPVVFVVNNNQWAISVPLNKQTACETLAQKAIAAGIEGCQVDGNDIIACCDQITKAVDKARQGNGPTVIEAITYRLCDHTTADDANRYQPAAEVKAAEAKEPVNRLRRYLETKSWWDEGQEKALVEECSDKVEKAVTAYSERTPQSTGSMFDYHYEQIPEYLIEQRAIAMEESDNA